MPTDRFSHVYWSIQLCCVTQYISVLEKRDAEVRELDPNLGNTFSRFHVLVTYCEN